MKFLAFVTFFVVADLSLAKYAMESGFSSEEKQRIVDLHNHFRAKVARGDQPGQPSAANMLAVTWDDSIAEKAQFWADICLPVHDAPRDRAAKPYNSVGQNIANGASINEAVKRWYDEVTKTSFQYAGQTCEGDCSQYTQVVWWKSWNLGCGQNQCTKNQKSTNFVCNYAPSGNVEKVDGGTDEMYKNGPPCSGCPNGFGYCMNGSLCASKDQCFTTNTPCTCTIKSCENGGLFDEYTCSCLCQTGFKGLTCEQFCVDQNDFCDLQKSDCAWNSRYNDYTLQKCEKTCAACGPLENLDGLNRAGITTNVYNLSDDLSCVNEASDRSCEEQPYVCRQMTSWARENCARFCGFCRPIPGPGVETYAGNDTGPQPPVGTTKTGKLDAAGEKQQNVYKIDERPSNDGRISGRDSSGALRTSSRITVSMVLAVVAILFVL